MENVSEKEYKKIQRYKIRSVILICLTALFLGALVFSYFHITTSARLALREAKNVKLALDMLDVEYYGRQSSVYDADKRDGLSDGVLKRLESITGQTGRTELLSYDKKERKTTGMTYETDHYRVVYQYDKSEGDSWKVDYLITIFDY